MKRARGCLVVAFIFGCGFLVGGFLGAAFGWVGFFHKVVKGGPRAVQQIIVERAKDDLGLKPEQRAAVAKIVEETAKELGEATADTRPKVEEIMGRAEERVRAILDAEQRAKFDNFANQGRRRWKVMQETAAPPPSATPEPKETPVPEQ
jgi:hypothetical protein